MDALNARTKHSAQRFHSVIYRNVLIIILCSLYDRLALHMLHISVLSFSKWFQSYFKHFKTITANNAHLKYLWRINALFIGLKISAKFSYRADTDNRKNGHLSVDTDIVANLLCIPKTFFLFHNDISPHFKFLLSNERLDFWCYFF